MFDDYIKCLNSYNNFVFAADVKGSFKIFLLNEKDIENEDDTMITKEFIHVTGIEWVSH